jgi:hypothetical protein
MSLIKSNASTGRIMQPCHGFRKRRHRNVPCLSEAFAFLASGMVFHDTSPPLDWKNFAEEIPAH